MFSLQMVTLTFILPSYNKFAAVLVKMKRGRASPETLFVNSIPRVTVLVNVEDFIASVAVLGIAAGAPGLFSAYSLDLRRTAWASYKPPLRRNVSDIDYRVYLM
ncbi:hypothetical protein RRF57_000129 [Xylaria bambusicola]|uniref:Uncharacterized protein n=1 Tax=Xylaria bambusicola TaxID=326684 RepID=A0AAN7Z282_9PEZI